MSRDWGQWGNEMISPKQHFARVEAVLADMVERVPEFTIELPLPASQAKWNDLANEWYVERHPDRWQLIFFDGNGSHWRILRRENYDTDDDLLFALVSMRLGFYRGDAFRLEVMTKISPEFGEREALLQQKKPNRDK